MPKHPLHGLYIEVQEEVAGNFFQQRRAFVENRQESVTAWLYAIETEKHLALFKQILSEEETFSIHSEVTVALFFGSSAHGNGVYGLFEWIRNDLIEKSAFVEPEIDLILRNKAAQFGKNFASHDDSVGRVRIPAGEKSPSMIAYLKALEARSSALLSIKKYKKRNLYKPRSFKGFEIQINRKTLQVIVSAAHAAELQFRTHYQMHIHELGLRVQNDKIDRHLLNQRMQIKSQLMSAGFNESAVDIFLDERGGLVLSPMPTRHMSTFGNRWIQGLLGPG